MAATKAMQKPRRAPKRRATAAASHRVTIDRLAPDDAKLREFISDFSAASALMRQLRHRLAETIELSAAGHSVMLGLWHCEQRGSTSVRTLADHLHVAAAHVTAELGKLARAGLVIKRPSASDGRAVNVELTHNGHALLDRLAPLLREVNTSLFANIRYSEMLTVQRFFRVLIDQAPEAIQIADLHAAREARPIRRD
ncbi:MAG TPA: MarR family transcriptional regulator [Xanthobacteraceae bacterium]|jgi:DNA-binding MarR family transcriptional regulator